MVPLNDGKLLSNVREIDGLRECRLIISDVMLSVVCLGSFKVIKWHIHLTL